jgi:hypothetical protein
VISDQGRFRREQVTFAGKATAWMRTAESGNALTFHFCPTCGSTVYWESEGFPGYVAVAIGNFADQNFPASHALVLFAPPSAGSTIGRILRPHHCRAQGAPARGAGSSKNLGVTGEQNRLGHIHDIGVGAAEH